MIKYITVFIILTILGYFYDKYKEKLSNYSESENEVLIRKYLLNDGYKPNNKPPLWIYIEHEYNSRNWTSFGSRSSTNLNQPYLYLTVKSIINQGAEDFNVCLINDNSIHKLLPNWNIELDNLANPLKQHFRRLAMMKILYNYGGMIVPPSYLALKPMYEIYDMGLSENELFSIELPSKSIISNIKDTNCSTKFMGATSQCAKLKDFIHTLERLCSSDFSQENDFTGTVERELNKMVMDKNMTSICGKYVGCIDDDDKTITVNELMGTSYIQFSDKMKGIFIPNEELLLRTRFGWFPRMSEKQILSSDVILCKFIITSVFK